MGKKCEFLRVVVDNLGLTRMNIVNIRSKYKSGDTEEISEAESAYKILGGRKRDVFVYSLPENYGERSLAVIEKVRPTPAKYPRGNGKERKSPL